MTKLEMYDTIMDIIAEFGTDIMMMDYYLNRNQMNDLSDDSCLLYEERISGFIRQRYHDLVILFRALKDADMDLINSPCAGH